MKKETITQDDFLRLADDRSINSSKQVKIVFKKLIEDGVKANDREPLIAYLRENHISELTKLITQCFVRGNQNDKKAAWNFLDAVFKYDQQLAVLLYSNAAYKNGHRAFSLDAIQQPIFDDKINSKITEDNTDNLFIGHLLKHDPIFTKQALWALHSKSDINLDNVTLETLNPKAVNTYLQEEEKSRQPKWYSLRRVAKKISFLANKLTNLISDKVQPGAVVNQEDKKATVVESSEVNHWQGIAATLQDKQLIESRADIDALDKQAIDFRKVTEMNKGEIVEERCRDAQVRAQIDKQTQLYKSNFDRVVEQISDDVETKETISAAPTPEKPKIEAASTPKKPELEAASTPEKPKIEAASTPEKVDLVADKTPTKKRKHVGKEEDSVEATTPKKKTRRRLFPKTEESQSQSPQGATVVAIKDENGDTNILDLTGTEAGAMLREQYWNQSTPKGFNPSAFNFDANSGQGGTPSTDADLNLNSPLSGNTAQPLQIC